MKKVRNLKLGKGNIVCLMLHEVDHLNGTLFIDHLKVNKLDNYLCYFQRIVWLVTFICRVFVRLKLLATKI